MTKQVKRRLVVRKTISQLSIADVESAMSCKVDAWYPYMCHHVAMALVRGGLVAGRAEYGLVLPMAQRHGWVRRTDGLIVDPLRWMLEKKPVADAYVYVGPDTGYSRSDGKWGVGCLGGLPGRDSGTRQFDPQFSCECAEHVYGYLGQYNPLTDAQLRWLGLTLPPCYLGEFAREVYCTLRRLELHVGLPEDRIMRLFGSAEVPLTPALGNSRPVDAVPHFTPSWVRAGVGPYDVTPLVQQSEVPTAPPVEAEVNRKVKVIRKKPAAGVSSSADVAVDGRVDA